MEKAVHIIINNIYSFAQKTSKLYDCSIATSSIYATEKVRWIFRNNCDAMTKPRRRSCAPRGVNSAARPKCQRKDAFLNRRDLHDTSKRAQEAEWVYWPLSCFEAANDVFSELHIIFGKSMVWGFFVEMVLSIRAGTDCTFR